MINREYVLDRLKSKTMSIDEFNFDRLQGPPILSLFTPQDIAELNSIANSIRLSARPEEKYKMIDNIMNRRGFVKFIGGTNRLTYRAIEDNSILAKVAYDSVGLGDNPRDYQNQFIYKPFIPKVFEVSPCGTLAIVERVVPITSREEFISVASDIYEVINNWFIGEYVLEDIGTNYFMNWGIRKGFGPVLLDFPYVYKLDGNKLFCNAPSDFTPSGVCEGIIDYDDGYNYLYCTKCGAKYRAKELETAVKDNKILIKSKGEIKMKISFEGGSVVEETIVETGKYADLEKVTPTKPIKEAPLRIAEAWDPIKNDKSDSSKEKYAEFDNKKKESPIEFTETDVTNKTSMLEMLKEFNNLLNSLREISDIDQNILIDMLDSLVSLIDNKKILIDFIINIIDTLNEEELSKVLNNLTLYYDIDKDISENDTVFDDIEYYRAKIINTKDILETEQPKKIIVIVDENDTIMTNDNDNIIAIDTVCDRKLNQLSIVSKKWLDGTISKFSSDDREDLDIIEEAEKEEQNNIENKPETTINVPTGVLPPTVSVNGVPVNDNNEKEGSEN